MKASISVLVLLVATPALAAQQPYGWTISASSTDPFVNTTVATFGIEPFYIWLVCCDLPSYPDGTPRQQGMAGASFGLVATGIGLLAFTQPCIVLNPPPLPDVLICALGCPCGPVVLGTLLVLNLPGSICFGPPSQGDFGTVDCESNPQLWAMDWIGIDTTGQGAPCSQGALCEKPIPVDASSWGGIKGTYR